MALTLPMPWHICTMYTTYYSITEIYKEIISWLGISFTCTRPFLQIGGQYNCYCGTPKQKWHGVLQKIHNKLIFLMKIQCGRQVGPKHMPPPPFLETFPGHMLSAGILLLVVRTHIPTHYQDCQQITFIIDTLSMIYTFYCFCLLDSFTALATFISAENKEKQVH